VSDAYRPLFVEVPIKREPFRRVDWPTAARQSNGAFKMFFTLYLESMLRSGDPFSEFGITDAVVINDVPCGTIYITWKRECGHRCRAELHEKALLLAPTPASMIDYIGTRILNAERTCSCMTRPR